MMTERETAEYNAHWRAVCRMAQEGAARGYGPRSPTTSKLWALRWRRIAELEAEPYNPWTPPAHGR